MTTATDRAVAPAGSLLGLGARPTGHDPDWHAQLRQEASGWVAEHGFPTTKEEDWRYTRLEPILEVPFVPATGNPIAENKSHVLLSATIDALGAGLGGGCLVFVNGHFAPEASRLAALPEGVRVTSLASVIAQEGGQLRSYWLPRSGRYRHAFGALNAALAEDGAFIELSPGTVVEEPIELVFFTGTDGSPLLSSPRSVVLAGADSRATVVETYVGIPADRYCTNAVTEVVLAEGAQIDHYKIQNESERAFHLASLDVDQARASRFSSHLVSLGAAISRHEVRVCLDAEYAEVNLEGLYLARGNQHHDNPILIEHAAPRCVSRQLYKGIVDNHGHGVFNGHIVVLPGASGTDARQSNKNLLLSDQAEVDTRPRLEIFADDVMCTHGATVGRLDEDALFYLRSRGIPHQTARGLLTNGFAHEMVACWHPAALRARVENLLAHRFTADEDEVETKNVPTPPGSPREGAVSS
jgi:Fe-S cluster assembly protein SufD